MGREIRRVPPGWEHPIDPMKDGYIHEVDGSKPKEFLPLRWRYEEEAAEWEAGATAWQAGTWSYASVTQPPNEPRTIEGFIDWHGPRPVRADPRDPEYGEYVWYTPAEATHYQVYETVSEGTPVSPVFATEADLVDWLIAQGHSRENAEAFLEVGEVPSLSLEKTGYVENIHGAASMRGKRALDS